MTQETKENKNILTAFFSKKSKEDDKSIRKNNYQIGPDIFKIGQISSERYPEDALKRLAEINNANALIAGHEAIKKEWEAKQYAIMGGFALAIMCVILGLTVVSRSPGKIVLEKDNTNTEKGIAVSLETLWITVAVCATAGGVYKIMNTLNSFFKEPNDRTNPVNVPRRSTPMIEEVEEPNTNNSIFKNK